MRRRERRERGREKGFRRARNVSGYRTINVKEREGRRKGEEGIEKEGKLLKVKN